MGKQYTVTERNNLDVSELSDIIRVQQDQIKNMNSNFEKLLVQFLVANQKRFGGHSEKLDIY